MKEKKKKEKKIEDEREGGHEGEEQEGGRDVRKEVHYEFTVHNLTCNVLIQVVTYNMYMILYTY